MSFSLSRLLAPDSASLEHLAALTAAMRSAVDQVSQLMGSTPAHAADVDAELARIDAEATARLMGLMTSLRSAFITPLPREDLYLLADGLNNAVDKVCIAGGVIIATQQYRLPGEAMDILEILGRQADLLEDATRQFRDLDQLEETWVQLQRMCTRAERLLVQWVSGMTGDLLQRNYNRQRETARGLEAAVAAVRQVAVHLGRVLVRES
ncbi:hypothetical protein E7744_00435 [Citricoccus sp. SGAir0253]|uniref:hypothetical protein n=1 Tax=Citricoccus sp. SGAir0253 TaxID=2567881 RepID=UPI0010CD384A|nr:hypothetical protein [Citricoccus sp. SGAir0253]QCU76872.1 hypothetical protein E7744_00435 [Citricoccus sp. SGAir0253]